MHQAQAIALDVEKPSCSNRLGDAVGKKIAIDTRTFIKAPDPRPNFRRWTKSRPAEKAAVMAFDAHRLAGVSAAARNRTVEYPGVAPQQGALLAFL